MHVPDLAPLAAILVGTSPPEIVALEARLRAAQLAADTAELNELIADELLFTGPDGQLGTKAQDLEAYATESVRFLAHAPVELRVRSVGPDIAVTALLTRLAVRAGGVLVQGSYRYTRLWAREAEGTWRVVAGHVSALPDAPPQG